MSNLVLIDSGMMLLFGTFVLEVKTAFLAMLLVAVIVADLRSRRIPNRLVLLGLLIAVGLHSFSSAGWGLVYALKGALVGFAMLLPLYMLRVLGAGDVKLMAMVGSFLGPVATIGTVLMTLVAGGVLALAVALWNGVFTVALANIRALLSNVRVAAFTGASSRVQTSHTAAVKLPYAVAIATGTATQILLAANGRALIG